MKLKDRIQIYIKNNKHISFKKTSIISLIIFVLIIGGNIITNNKIYSTDYKSSASNSILKSTFVGDIMMSRSIEKITEKKGYKSLFEKVSHVWSDSDYVFGNLENAVLTKNKLAYEERPDKEILLGTNKKAVEAIKSSGFNMLSIANNHTADFGKEGIVDTINTLKQYDLNYVGAGKNIEEAASYQLTEINGIKVATVAINDIFLKGYAATENEPGMLTTTYPEYYSLIKEASEVSDITVVVPHWGIEYDLKAPSDRQQELARGFINAGADIVVGGHPHVVQPVELYKDGIIFYSLGNFVFDQGYTRTKDSIIVNYTIDNNGEGLFEIIPARIKHGQPHITNNSYYVKRIINQLTEMLDENTYIIKDNKVLINAASVNLDEIHKKQELEKNNENTTTTNTIE